MEAREPSGIEKGDLTEEDADRIADSFRPSWDDLDEAEIKAGASTLKDELAALTAPATLKLDPVPKVGADALINLAKTLPLAVKSPAAGMSARAAAPLNDSHLDEDTIPKKSGRGLVYAAVGVLALIGIGIAATNSMRVSSSEVKPVPTEVGDGKGRLEAIPPPATVEPPRVTTQAASARPVDTARAEPKAVDLPKVPPDPAKAGRAEPSAKAGGSEGPKAGHVAEPPGPGKAGHGEPAAKGSGAKAPPPEPTTPKAPQATPPAAATTVAPATATVSAAPPAPTATEPKTAPRGSGAGIVRDTPF